MTKQIIVIIGIITSFQIAFSQNIETGKKVLEFLAADKQKGRYPGTLEDQNVQNFLDKKFHENRMEKFSFGYIQPFTVQTGIDINKNTSLTIGNVVATQNDFQPFVFSAEAKVNGKIAYVGSTLKETNIDVTEKWILLCIDNNKNETPSFKQILSETMLAKERKAKGLLIFAKNDLTPNGEYYPFQNTRTVIPLSIPVVQISRKFLQKIIEKKGLTFQELYNTKPTNVNKKINTLEVQANIDFNHKIKNTANVAAYIEGTESNQWIVLGAHFDHLGYGGHGSGSRVPDKHAIHNGADDNASGVAMVMMLAEYYKKNPPKSNMAFVLFGAEEIGLLGSKYFVNNLPFPKEKIKTMVNFDMVGRVIDSALSISGVKTAKEFDNLLSQWQNDPLKLSLGGDGYSGSDQASFYAEKIPVLFFNSGLHKDYHTPEDDVDKINYKGMEMVAKLSVKLIDSLISPTFQLTYQPAKSQNQGRYSKKMQVSMGIMPDIAGTTKNGLGVDGVTAGKPADKAGIQKGDAIIEIDEKKVSNIYEYMHCLSKLEKGQKVNVKVRRKKEIIELKVQF